MARIGAVSLLALVSLRPCAAIRLAEELENLHGKSEDESVLSESADSDFWVSCPSQMEAVSEKGSDDQCTYSALDLWQPESPSLGAVFDHHSDQPLYFNKRSTAFNCTLAFTSEFVDALADDDTFQAMLAEFGASEIERNETLSDEFQEWIRDISHTEFADGSSDFIAGFHGVEASALPAVFVIEKGLEHWLIAEVIVLTHALEKAAHHHAVWGQVFFENLFGVSLASTAHVVEHTLHIFLHYVLTPLLAIEAYIILKEYQVLWDEAVESSEDFVMRLVLRGDCVIQRTSLTVANMDPTAINPVVAEVCGTNVTELLSNLMIRTHKTMEAFFGTVAHMGKCLNPGEAGAEDRRSKVTCARRLYRPLRETRSRPGQLWSALTFISLIMKVTDDLLVVPHYGLIMQEKFGIAPPVDSDSAGFSEIKDIQAVVGGTFDERFLVCYTMSATHRAFELSLSRLEQSMRIWVQTFGRRKTAANVWGASWKPCQKVFHRIGEEEQTDELESLSDTVRSSSPRTGFCKLDKLQWDETRLAAEEIACSSEMNWPQWACAERTRFQDKEWCKHADIFEGFQYRFFGHDKTACGCECCRREDVRTGSLWPELASGGHH